ncbi:MAG: HNH endonuclease [bacterium]|nr:HNH endonuclease [bacterium]
MTIRCRGCNSPLTEANNSEAHVIPQALGGRLAPRDILCQTCNGRLNDTVDLPLVKALGAWPTLLNVPRQRGKQPSQTVHTRKGHKVSLESGGSMMRIDVVYDVTPIAQGDYVVIGAGQMKTARQLIQRAKNEFPQLDVTQAEKHLKTISLSRDDEIKLSLDFSPQAIFGGVLSGIWIYLIYTTGHAFCQWNDLLSRIAKMQEHGGLFRYLIDGLPGLKGPKIDLGHKIVVRAVPNTGELIIYMEIMGALRVGGVFAKCPLGTVVEHVYVYDLSKMADRSKEFSIDGATFDAQDWRKVGLGPTNAEAPALRAHFNEQMKLLADVFYHQRPAAVVSSQKPSAAANTSTKPANTDPTTS